MNKEMLYLKPTRKLKLKLYFYLWNNTYTNEQFLVFIKIVLIFSLMLVQHHFSQGGYFWLYSGVTSDLVRQTHS